MLCPGSGNIKGNLMKFVKIKGESVKTKPKRKIKKIRCFNFFLDSEHKGTEPKLTLPDSGLILALETGE